MFLEMRRIRNGFLALGLAITLAVLWLLGSFLSNWLGQYIEPAHFLTLGIGICLGLFFGVLRTPPAQAPVKLKKKKKGLFR